ncbi:NADH-Ubiquinone/plastoquinone (complex I), various chains family protein [Mycobacterium xenopi 3993]|nr:NADH-Ubiquinone/plastoquinone (complex I), various chains family protein [Mycobacterium xenopi 3993]
MLLITGVGSLIHIYSIGYMADDPDRRRFFAHLNLFVAAMLLLVLADNYLGLYLGWEGVGLASYLLIGFWYERPSAATAAKKAFVVNRVGDVGLTVAMMVMFAAFGTISFNGVFTAASSADERALTAIGLSLLWAACGKSAQVPLQSWLGDAMEAPPGVRADPRRHHGDRRRLPDCALKPGLRSGAECSSGRDARRRCHIAVRCDHRLRERRHKKGTGRLDDESDRLHGASRRPRPGRLRVRDPAPADPWLLQGRAVPRRRFGDARDERRSEHAPLRRPAHRPADHLPDVRAGLSGDHRSAPIGWILLQGRHHRGRAGLWGIRELFWARRRCWVPGSPRFI